MHIELVFDVEYDYQPIDAEVTICSVKKGDVEMIDSLTDEDIEAIEQMACMVSWMPL